MGREQGGPRERPVRSATVGALLVARTPLLQREWDGLGGGRQTGLDDRRARKSPELPMCGVSWHSARAWLARAGDGLRLPTEAEWEHLARAGTTTAFFWGDAPDAAFAWTRETAGGRPHAPEEHVERANAFGLVDVSGNVCEWCEEDLVLAMEGSAWQEWDPGKVHRGGSFDRPWSHARSSWREGADPRRAEPDVGFRPVVSLT